VAEESTDKSSKIPSMKFFKKDRQNGANSDDTANNSGSDIHNGEAANSKGKGSNR